MQSSPNVVRFPKPSDSLPPSVSCLPAPVIMPPAAAPGWKPAFGRAEFPAVPPNPRCSEKGCVFPAASGTSGQCRQHERQSREPILFSSHQPTHEVLERSRFNVPENEVETGASRSRDRRRLEALREAFLEE